MGQLLKVGVDCLKLGGSVLREKTYLGNGCKYATTKSDFLSGKQTAEQEIKRERSDTFHKQTN